MHVRGRGAGAHACREHLVDTAVVDERLHDGLYVLLTQVHPAEALGPDELGNVFEGGVALALYIRKARLPQHLDEFAVKLALGVPAGRQHGRGSIALSCAMYAA